MERLYLDLPVKVGRDGVAAALNAHITGQPAGLPGRETLNLVMETAYCVR